MVHLQKYIWFPLCLVLTVSTGLSQSWQAASDGFFTVYTASPADQEALRQVFEVLQEAQQDLARQAGFYLPAQVLVYIHPNLNSYTTTTQHPWFFAGLADRSENRIDIQRIKVLQERRSLRTTLRHELFHLAQPEAWSRWQAEGEAMHFAGELPVERPFSDLDPVELDRLLAEAATSETLKRAAATAYWWVLQEP